VRFEFLIQGVHVTYEDVDCAMSRQSIGAVCGLEMNNHPVSFNSSIERRLAIRELGSKPEYITVVRDASQDVLHDKQGCSTAERHRRRVVMTYSFVLGS
jgi:hypothetical protein